VRRNVTVGRNVHIGIGSILWAPNRLTVGDNVYIGKFCTIECNGSIGRDTMIANHVGLIGRYDHDFRCIGRTIRQSPWVGDANANHPGRELEIIIGPDVWIGYGSVLLSGIEVGRGAIVAAGSVVTKNVEPYAIVGGNPARALSFRFGGPDRALHERLTEGVAL